MRTMHTSALFTIFCLAVGIPSSFAHPSPSPKFDPSEPKNPLSKRSVPNPRRSSFKLYRTTSQDGTGSVTRSENHLRSSPYPSKPERTESRDQQKKTTKKVGPKQTTSDKLDQEMDELSRALAHHTVKTAEEKQLDALNEALDKFR
ncbi:hypothetical protein F5148DRAFT_1208828 [Russula earlei]|uniref:Uncharacterized protein n=1 Tax=Russula earlei TaxID=71964 RepID=A0ACC0U5W0_9AGAM|nr:hypothetical protein F5148DRAFT_1208828 [Russula earlei]